MFLDSDDAMDPVCLKTIDKVLTEKKPDILLFNGCVCKNEEITEQRIGNLGDEKKEIEVTDFRRQVLSSDKLSSLCIKAFRASLYANDTTDYSDMRGTKYGEDKVRLLYPLTLAKTVFYIPDVLYQYHSRDDSIVKCPFADTAIDRIANDMFHYLMLYMKIWHLNDVEDQRRLADYYMRNFSQYLFLSEKEYYSCGMCGKTDKAPFPDRI